MKEFNNIKCVRCYYKDENGEQVEGRHFYLSDEYPEKTDIYAVLVDKDYIENDEAMEYCFKVYSRKGSVFNVYFEQEEWQFYTVKVR